MSEPREPAPTPDNTNTGYTLSRSDGLTFAIASNGALRCWRCGHVENKWRWTWQTIDEHVCELPEENVKLGRDADGEPVPFLGSTSGPQWQLAMLHRHALADIRKIVRDEVALGRHWQEARLHRQADAFTAALDDARRQIIESAREALSTLGESIVEALTPEPGPEPSDEPEPTIVYGQRVPCISCGRVRLASDPPCRCLWGEVDNGNRDAETRCYDAGYDAGFKAAREPVETSEPAQTHALNLRRGMIVFVEGAPHLVERGGERFVLTPLLVELDHPDAGLVVKGGPEMHRDRKWPTYSVGDDVRVLGGIEGSDENRLRTITSVYPFPHRDVYRVSGIEAGVHASVLQAW